VSPLSKIIPDTVKFHQYADDMQLYCSISTSEFASEVTRLQDCVRDVSDWFLTNCMQLNGQKSKAVLFARGAQAAKFDPKATDDIAGSTTNCPSTSGASVFTGTVNSIWIGM
jgi:hypothetical protein